MAESHYDTLGVSPAAPPEVVRAAYQALAKLYHPDGETPDEDRMKGINVAWGVLRDPVTRSAYDAELEDASSAATSTVGPDAETSEPVLGDEGWGEGVEDPPPAHDHVPTWSPPPAPPGPPPPPWLAPQVPPSWHTAPQVPPSWYASPPPPRWYSPPPPPPPPPFRSGPPGPLVPDPTAVVGLRLGAFLIDAVLIAALAYALWFLLVVTRYEAVPAGDGGDPGAICDGFGDAVGDCQTFGDTAYLGDDDESNLVGVLAWVVPFVSIHAVLQGARGYTPGKLVLRLRTVGEDGRPVRMSRAFLRTVLWVADAAPWCLPISGPCLVLTTVGHRRIGDMAARTFVVRVTDVGAPVVVPGLAAPTHVPA